MVQVFLNDVLIAEGDNLPVVEGNYYFPPDAIKKEYFDDSSDTQCVRSHRPVSHSDAVVAPCVVGKGELDSGHPTIFH